MKLLSVLVTALVAAGCNCKEKTIAEVGGCDLQGKCRVRYTDGSDGFQYNFPVAGIEVKDCQP